MYLLTILMDNPSVADVLVVFAWLFFIALIFMRQKWFFSFEERFPRLRVFDLLIYTDTQRFLFLIGRLIVFSVVLFVVGSIIRIIFE